MSTERLRADLLVRQRKTTADKVRTLAKAGYSRTGSQVSRVGISASYGRGSLRGAVWNPSPTSFPLDPNSAVQLQVLQDLLDFVTQTVRAFGVQRYRDI